MGYGSSAKAIWVQAMSDDTPTYVVILRTGRGSFSMHVPVHDTAAAVEYAKRWVENIPTPPDATLIVRCPDGEEIAPSFDRLDCQSLRPFSATK